MDPYVTYLFAVNILAFLFHTLDYHVCMGAGREELIDHRVLSVFAIIGGGAGMLAAFLVWDRRVNKNNVAWRFIAIIGVIIWALITFYVHGIVEFDTASLISPIDFCDLVPLVIYFIAVNLATFAAFVYDKLRARQGRVRDRLPELALLGLSLAGGAAGGIAAMYFVRHKTQKWYFTWGLPIMVILQVALFICLRLGGIV